MIFTLVVMLLMPPQPPLALPFGPFYSAADCERAYSTVAAKYQGKTPLLHECKPANG